MANFVLVHGAWHGGWCWRHVVRALSGAGHTAHAVTLTGLGERVHLMSPAITLETHIADVIERDRDGRDGRPGAGGPLLCGHDWHGRRRCAAPNGCGIWSTWTRWCPNPARAGAAPTPAPLAKRDWWRRRHLPTSAFHRPILRFMGSTAQHCEWLRRRLTPHPGHTYQATLDFDPRRVAAIARTLVNCTQPRACHHRRHPATAGGQPVMGWRLALGRRRANPGAQTGHDPMVSAHAELTRILLDCV